MMIDVDNLTRKTLAALLDSTYLKAFGGPEKIDDLCRAAVAGFPLGQMSAEAKLFEVRDVIAQGAGEVDIVQNVRRLQAGDTAYVLAELAEFAKICHGEGVTSKVIFENCYLTREEKLLSCKIACEAGVDFVKTSTGFGTGGATLEDVQLMRAAIGPERGLKAAGGIRTCEDALAMLRAGATRLGTSAGRVIVEGLV